MHHGLDASLGVGPDGQHVAPVALGDDCFLQMGGDAFVVKHAFHLGEQAVVGNRNLAPDAAQAVGGRIHDLTAVADRPADGVNQAGVGR